MIELFVLFFVILFGFGFVMVNMQLSKANYLIIRTPADKTNFIDIVRMVESKDKETGVLWWKSVFWAKKMKIPAPPPEALDVGKKGRKVLEVYKLSEDEYIYIKDEGLQTKEKRKFVDNLKPFSAVQRQVVVDQFAKAEAMRQHSWLKENAMNLAALGFMMIIIIMFVVYWGDIAKFTLQKDAASAGLLREAKILLDDLDGDRQHVTTEAQAATVVVENSEAIPRGEGG